MGFGGTARPGTRATCDSDLPTCRKRTPSLISLMYRSCSAPAFSPQPSLPIRPPTHTHTHTHPPTQLVPLPSFIEDKLRQKDATADKLRLKNTTTKALITKLEHQLAHKEEMGEVGLALLFCLGAGDLPCTTGTA